MVVPVGANPQVTPVCAGYEFTANANNCLKIANTNNVAWPYAATCPVLSAANFLQSDPDGGLWTWPRAPKPVYYFLRNSGNPVPLPADGQTAQWFGSSFTVTEPTGCMPARLSLEANFWVGVNLPSGQFTQFAAELNDSQYGGLGSSFRPDQEQYAWDGPGAQTAYMNSSDTWSVQLYPGQTYTVWTNLFVRCGAQVTPIPAPAQVAYWRLEVAGTLWPAGGS
jgi:hypothetical protein